MNIEPEMPTVQLVAAARVAGGAGWSWSFPSAAVRPRGRVRARAGWNWRGAGGVTQASRIKCSP